MKRDKWLYILLGVLFVLYAAIEHFAPEPLSWQPTYSPKDKNPYGAFVLYDRLEDFFEEKSTEYKPMLESEAGVQNVIVLCESFGTDEYDMSRVLQMVNEGSQILIASSYFEQIVLDTLGLDITFNSKFEEMLSEDSVQIIWGNQSSFYPNGMFGNVFEVSDSSSWEVLAKTDEPILVSKPFGSGKLILATCPLVFTNFGILKHNGYQFPEWVLNHLEKGAVVYNQYYQAGRMESSSEFRFFMSHTSLRWAVYLTLLGLMLILFVSSRRKQQAIEILEPKTNTTIEFIKTIGGLYYQERNHKKAAEKLSIHFLRVLKEKYFISDFYAESTYSLLAAKSGVSKEEVIRTMEIIKQIKEGRFVSEDMLALLSSQLHRFNIK